MTTRIGVLGPVRIADRDAGGTPMRAMLAALVLAGTGTTRSVAALADDVWGEEQPQNPRAALQTLVSRARATAGADAIASGPGGYALGTEDTDLHTARRLQSLAEALPQGDPERIRLLREAIGLWRGEPGADLGGSPVGADLAAEAGTLHDALRGCLATELVRTGSAAEGIGILRELASARPLDETAQAALMSALAADGRSAEALAVFAALRTALADALGASPGPAITELNARLLRSSDGGPRVRIGVQAAPNELIGRDDALARARALLREARVVTILGAGGLGKTRLAQALALESDAHSVVVVPLAGVRDGAGVPVAIAAALGISENAPGGRLAEQRPRPDLGARIVAALGDRETMLVLDNCEQVIDAVAWWSSDLLAAVPSLRILTTSRAPLAIGAERVLPLEPLEIAVTDAAPAVRLFLDRARAARPSATLELEVVARLCARLDGLPLAIELAAARVRTMTPEQIERRLENRFALLTTGDRSAPERHRTLEAVIEWSWDLLDAEAQHALAMLSVLPGGFSEETAEAVLTAPADDVLERLVSHSLLNVIDDGADQAVRFRMLETVREFGRDRLVDADAEDRAWEAVVAWALSFAEEHGARARVLPSGLTAQAHRAITREHDNLVHVLRHLISAGRGADAVRLFTVLGQSWFIRGSFTEFIGYAGPMIDVADAVPSGDIEPDLRVMALVMASLGSMISGDPRSARGLAFTARALAAAGDAVAPAWALVADALLTVGRGGPMGSVSAEPEESDPWALLTADVLLSHRAENDGEAEVAMEAARRAWQRARGLGERWAEGMAADLAAQLAAQSARPLEAMTWMERATAVFEEFDAQDQINHQEWVRGGVLLCLGRSGEARALFTRLIQEGGLSQDGVELASIGLYGLAEAELLDGRTANAADAFARAMAAFADPAHRRSPWYLMALAGYVSVAARSLGVAESELLVWERRLRTRTIAACRLRREGVDRPVLGTALLGWSAWAVRRPGLVDRGAEAIALAEVLGGRQNMPSLDLGAHLADAERLAGADALAHARAAAATLEPAERVVRGLAVLGARVGP
ncbi:Predicted ATPase [Microbacterium sp. 8M]|uniref:ATP-binding protein n=1 Tax=Microbacterium sp. 8M TaxID=2653153 RepID=UPI0012F40C28|nr:BTAD domain-containing putative transcriptional regulator [Microbacterium sp. 8M]VXB04046.1 Predicted ATPase [Microbacterium sp. 8M]